MADARARIRITRVLAPDELGTQIEPKMRNLGNAIGRRMQRLVPKKTWALHDSIEVATDREGARVTIQVGVGSAKVDYWRHVEQGTSRQKAQPYMRPALLQSRASDFLNESPLGPTKGARDEAKAQRRADAKAGRGSYVYNYTADGKRYRSYIKPKGGDS
jgi:HK97 gp10 family phage protein